MAKKIFITLDATSKCNRQCQHCGMDANTENVSHFTLRMTELLIEELNKYEKAEISITGGGEPLLNPYLPKIIDKFREKLGKKLYFNIITSGALLSETKEMGRLKRILKRHGSDKVMELVASFNLFNPTFPERIRNTLLLAAKSSNLRRFTIKLCFSIENVLETHVKLDETFDKMRQDCEAAMDPYLVFSYPASGKFVVPEYGVEDDFFSAKQWSEFYMEVRKIVAHTYPSTYIMRMFEFPRNLFLYVAPFPLIKRGRGKNIKGKGHPPNCDVILNGDYFRRTRRHEIHISSSGYLLPTCSCPRSEEMSFGKIGETPLIEAIKKIDLFGNETRKHLLADQRIFPRDNLCEICKELKARYFKF